MNAKIITVILFSIVGVFFISCENNPVRDLTDELGITEDQEEKEAQDKLLWLLIIASSNNSASNNCNGSSCVP